MRVFLLLWSGHYWSKRHKVDGCWIDKRSSPILILLQEKNWPDGKIERTFLTPDGDVIRRIASPEYWTRSIKEIE